jgi:cysteinyl-tRNA synthetase
LIQASKDAVKLPVVAETSELGVDSLINKIYDALCDDLNTPVAISHIFDAVKIVNQVKEKQLALSQSEKESLIYIFNTLLTENTRP